MSKVYKIVAAGIDQNDSGDNLFCSLCGYTLTSEDDLQSNSDHSCCHECFLNFAQSRKNEWKEGWRPKKSTIRKYINNRKRLIINITKRQEKS
mgnify:CR=1 FL=1